MLRKHKKLFIFLVLIIFFSGVGILGYIYAKNEPRVVEEDTSDTEVAVNADDARIADDATIEWDYEYTMCCHHIYVSCAVSEDMAGLTFSELQEKYPDVIVIEFDTDELVLKKKYNCYCPEHYILKKYGDELAIYRTAVGTDKQYVYLEIAILFDAIEDDEQEVLEIGKVFNSLSDLEAYLEDIET